MLLFGLIISIIILYDSQCEVNHPISLTSRWPVIPDQIFLTFLRIIDIGQFWSVVLFSPALLIEYGWRTLTDWRTFSKYII